MTGYSHPRCYAQKYNDCSTKISKEHFISETLLRQIELNNTAKIAGLKWQQPETFNVVPLPGLASAVLCERHNNFLSPLDDCMGKFSESIRNYDTALRSEKTARTSESRRFSGDEIARWMLKCLLGLTASNNLKTTNLKPECLDLLFLKQPWPAGWGIYFSVSGNATLHHSESFLIETLIDSGRHLILAARFTIRGLPFLLCLGKPDSPSSFGSHQPAAIILKAHQCEKVLQLSWSHGVASPPVLLSRSGTYDGPPPDWRDWEKNG